MGQSQIRMSRISVLVVFFLAAAESVKQVERHPKLFFVSTSSTTTTISTGSVCYISSTSLTTCSGRKRRAISFDGAQLDQSDVEPSQLTEGVRSSKELGMDRKGKFLLYWITTTSISTSTSFTTTFSIDSVLCTPTGASICG